MSTVIFEKLAEEFGVSTRTVRRVLNSELRDNRPTIVERARRIRSRAQELNYRPNAAAKAIARGRFGSIGLLSSAVHYRAVIGRVFYGIQEACREHNQHLIIGDVPDQKLSEGGYIPKILREWSADGLLINYTHDFPPPMRAMIREHRIPSIWINTKLETDCIYPDDRAGARRAVEYLLERGHRRIAYTSTILTSHFSQADRLAGSRDAMADAGLELETVLPPADANDERAFLPRWLERLRRRDRPTAVFAYGDNDGRGLLTAALMAGVRVPQDLSIIAVASEPIFVGLTVTTLALPHLEIGQGAVEMLMKKIARPETSRRPRALPLTLKPGDTVASPAGT